VDGVGYGKGPDQLPHMIGQLLAHHVVMPPHVCEGDVRVDSLALDRVVNSAGRASKF
jgi:hypothetical protein